MWRGGSAPHIIALWMATRVLTGAIEFSFSATQSLQRIVGCGRLLCRRLLGRRLARMGGRRGWRRLANITGYFGFQGFNVAGNGC
jgi:hypothetical protein